MEEVGENLISDNDERQHFHGVYVRTTRAVMRDAEAGRFVDPEWAVRWLLAFAGFYMDAFDTWERGDDPSGPWRVAFEASRDPDIPPLRHALLGMNAHINYDLPQAFLAVITDSEFDDDELMAKRALDHAHLDSILVGRVHEEDKLMAQVEEPGDRTIIDSLMMPFNTAGTKRFLKEGRHKVWRNARLLSAARRQGPEVYAHELSALEALCEERVTDLVTPRFVIIQLAWHGFGVELSPRPAV